ncbi:MAG: GTPase domain-containing protein, partial [Betaproteobacteria bacterium]
MNPKTGGAAAARIDLALVSHTNVGKTSLARTLLGADVGEVRDAPHVTDLAEPHVLLTTPADDALRLWDTPGFGDSARLLKRLRTADNPIGWLLREVWDRYRDRPFWC